MGLENVELALKNCRRLLGSLAGLPRLASANVPRSALRDNAWREVIAASAAVCECGSRRVLAPPIGRSRFRSHAGSPLYELMPQPSGSPQKYLRIVPVEGDNRSPHVWLEVADDSLVVLEDGFDAFRTKPGDPYGRRYEQRIPLLLLAEKIKRHGEVIFSRKITRGGLVKVPFWSVREVNPVKGLEAVKIELDTGAWLLLPDIKELPHDCICSW